MIGKIEELFISRTQEFGQSRIRYHRKSNYLSAVRVFMFVTAIILIIYFANDRHGEAIFFTSLIFTVSFGVVLKYHSRIKKKRTQYENLVTINNDEVRRMEGNLKSFDSGARFAGNLHPYARDLDIFGDNSLFQLLNRTTTEASRIKLAGWLNNAAGKEEIIKRQEAVKELSEKLDWRQNFHAAALHLDKSETSVKVLLNWINEPPVVKKVLYYRMLGFIMPILFFAATYLYAVHDWSYYYMAGIIVINILILRKFMPAAVEVTDKTSAGINSLKSNYELIKKIEQEDFLSAYLVQLKKNFRDRKFKASDKIKELNGILDFLNSRGNMFFAIIDAVFLADVHLLYKADKWKETNKMFVAEWFESLSTFEVLVSFAGFSYTNPDYPFPEISDEEHVFRAANLGHPLIKRAVRVKNDFELQGKGKIALITGSNMAGKSTFLRTVGVNKVLALAGAPVCADYMEVSVSQVFTSMRTEDNLEESVSSFYAELKRLKQLLDMLSTGEPVLFMLDEILKGTNSQDRHKGAKSLIKQLSRLNASGMVSTHDLELGSLAETMDNVVNYSFNSDVINDEIYFDYKLNAGICRSFNASKLMEKMGIEIED